MSGWKEGLSGHRFPPWDVPEGAFPVALSELLSEVLAEQPE